MSRPSPFRRSQVVLASQGGAGVLVVGAVLLWCACGFAADVVTTTNPHPDSSGDKWQDLFRSDLSDAEGSPAGWKYEDGVLAATKDEVIWTARSYKNFTLDLEFQNSEGTNSGVIVYASDMKEWIPNSVEIQIADDSYKKWAESPRNWQCGAIFGHVAPVESRVKAPGEWNRMSISCLGPAISVAVNGKMVAEMDMRRWRSAAINPDKTAIPAWLSRPLCELATEGRIGLQGKHGPAPIRFRRLRIKENVTASQKQDDKSPGEESDVSKESAETSP